MTLLELMVMIGILGLVSVMAIPAFTRYVRSNQLATNTERLAADIQLARTMAISNGRVYRLNAATTGYTILDPLSGETVRDREFDADVNLVGNASVDFFPWGMADAATLDLNCSVGSRSITILPTGVVEVN